MQLLGDYVALTAASLAYLLAGIYGWRMWERARSPGAALCIAPGTVKNHVTSILGKLGVSDRSQAALKAREMGLV